MYTDLDDGQQLIVAFVGNEGQPVVDLVHHFLREWRGGVAEISGPHLHHGHTPQHHHLPHPTQLQPSPGELDTLVI